MKKRKLIIWDSIRGYYRFYNKIIPKKCKQSKENKNIKGTNLNGNFAGLRWETIWVASASDVANILSQTWQVCLFKRPGGLPRWVVGASCVRSTVGGRGGLSTIGCEGWFRILPCGTANPDWAF